MAAKNADEVKSPISDKLKALQLAMDKIEKDHGKGAIMRMGDTKVEEVSFISTGSIGLN
ncbi:MAG: DNA recombination/repair protein RecA, partial [Paludibacter sp.]